VQIIHSTIREAIAYARHSRVAPAAINAPPPNFVPPSLGIGLSTSSEQGDKKSSQGLQADRVERDAWVGIRGALVQLKAAGLNQQENYGDMVE
jgi:hypothetical protein